MLLWEIAEKLKEILKLAGQMFFSHSHPSLLELTFLIKNKCKILHETVFQLI